MQREPGETSLTVFYGTDPAVAVPRIIEAMRPFDELSPGARVLIKPNLVVSREKWLGANTRVEIVEGIVAALQERGVSDITVADGSGMGESAGRAFSICGYDELARTYDVRLLDIEKDEFTERRTRIPGPFSALEISRTVAEADYLINVPVIKAHGQTKVTCSLKNLKGVMPRRLKTAFHGRDIERAIAQLADLVRPDFILADGTYGDLSSELGGNPVQIGIVAGGYDPIAVDAFAARTLGYSPEEIDHLAHYARSRTVEPGDYEPPIVALNRPSGATVFPAEAGRDREHRMRRYPCTVHTGSVCSTCEGNLRFALERLREARLLGRRDHYVIGRGAVEALEAAAPGAPAAPGGQDGPRDHAPLWAHPRTSERRRGRVVAAGDCARADLRRGATGTGAKAETVTVEVPGCPPQAEEIVEAVRGTYQ